MTPDGKLILKLVRQGYSHDEIRDYLEDEGYDDDDINEAFLELGYDWEKALIDAIKERQIPLEDIRYYADLLDVDDQEAYYWYFYGEDYEE